MPRLLVAIVSLAAAGCIDTVKCHTPTQWYVCSDGSVEPGASGTPPTIVSLASPTCAAVATPVVTGMIKVDDPDGDVQALKISVYEGVRLGEMDMPIAETGTSYGGAVSVTVPMAAAGAYDVRVKAVDRAGGQSAPVCNTITLLR